MSGFDARWTPPSSRVTRCVERSGHSPLIIYYHGGGFSGGSTISMAPFARGLARLFDAVVVCPTHCMAPENPFLKGPNECWDTLEWTASHAQSLGASPEKGFILSGRSAGGNFVGVLAELARLENLQPPLTGLWAQVPIFLQEDLCVLTVP